MRIFVFLLVPFFSFAQQNVSVNIEAKAHYGFIVPHHPGMKNLIKGHVKAFELNYDIPTFGEKQWEQLYNYPTWGFSFYYADLANPQQLGIATGIYPYINFSWMKKKKFQLNFHTGWGLGYVSKVFDRKDNYKNTVIGSKLNAIGGLGWEAEYKISERISSSLGICLRHFSNGTYKVPNLGINIPSVNLGMSYYIGQLNREFREDSVLPLDKKYEITAILAGGVKEMYPVNGPKYPAFTFSVNFAEKFSHKHQIACGFDFFNNTTLLKYYARKGITLKNNSEIIQSGLILFYVATISKVSIIAGMGGYLYTKYKLDGTFYHRIGMRYRINDNLFANVTLKTHFFRADFSEWGIGYKF